MPSPSNKKAVNLQNDTVIVDLDPQKRIRSISIIDKKLESFKVEKALKIMAYGAKKCGTRPADH